MIEHTAAIKSLASIIIKPLLAGLIALGWWPTTDFIILQVDHSVLLSPKAKVILDELRMILGVLISFVVLLKIIVGIIKFKIEKKS